MKEHELEHLVGELLGEDAIKAFFAQAEARADVIVEKNKKDMTPSEREKFRHECLRKAAWDQLRAYTVDAAQPRIMSKRWWVDASLKAVVNAAVLAGGVIAVGAITRASSTTTEETTEETTAGESPFRAASRPSRRSSHTENVASL